MGGRWESSTTTGSPPVARGQQLSEAQQQVPVVGVKHLEFAAQRREGRVPVETLQFTLNIAERFFATAVSLWATIALRHDHLEISGSQCLAPTL